MNKKGFTLIELLAVIVILGIIMALAIPEVLGYINRAKRDSLGNAVDIFQGGISLVDEAALSKDKPNGTYTITNGVIVEENPFTFDKKLSFDGTFTLSEGKISYTFYNSDGLCVSKKLNSDKKNFGVYKESKCLYEDNSDLFVFDYELNEILAFKSHDYIVNKDVCITTIQNDRFYGDYFDVDIAKAESFCNGEDVTIVLSKQGEVILNLDIYVFKWGDETLYELEGDGFLTIVGESPKNIIIPSKINGEDVLHIKDSAFAYQDLESVVLPNSILTIGYGAFKGNKLRKINLPGGLQVIGEGAFNANLFPDETAFIYSIDDPNYLVSYAGENIDNVVLPSNTTAIANESFYGLGITKVTLNEGLVNIGGCTFGENKISSLVLPSTVRSIEYEAFAYNQIVTLTLNEGLTTIESWAFGSNELTTVNIPSSVTTIGYASFADNQIDNVTLNEGIINIGSSAFSGNKLTTVNIPSSVTHIEDFAFGNNSLGNVTFSTGSQIGLNSIGYRVFSKTETSNNNLTSIIYRGTPVQNWNGVINGTNATSFVTGIVTNTLGDVTIIAN